MKVETAKTALILILMAYAIETWPWVQQSFRDEEARQATIELGRGVGHALEEAYQESQRAKMADQVSQLRDLGLRRMEER